MGSFLSLPYSKGFKMLSPIYDDENPTLIPCLPDVISVQIIARVPRIHYLKLKLVSRTWKSTITSSELFQVRKELKTTEELLYILAQAEDKELYWYVLDPLSGIWQRLPPMMGSSVGLPDVIRGWLGRRDANHTRDQMPYCGCATGAVDGCLYVLGGFSSTSVLSSVWKYDPIMNIWQEVSSMTTTRAFCKTGTLNGKLYVVGGVNWVKSEDWRIWTARGLVPLRSAEVFDPITGLWDAIPNIPFSNLQNLQPPEFIERVKPAAVGMSCYMGKLYVPQSIYSWPLFIDMGGEMYDPVTKSWADMPASMGMDWPVKKAGTKLSVVVNGELYALDHSTSLDDINIKIYDRHDNSWNVVIAKVPAFNDAECPYLLAGLLGKLHLVVKDSNNEIVVLEADLEKSVSDTLLASSPSTSSSSTIPEVQADVWKVIATKKVGAKDPISCQVLEI